MGNIAGISWVVNFIARQFAGNNLNTQEPVTVQRNSRDSFVTRNPAVGNVLAKRNPTAIPVGQAAQALRDLFSLAA